jgi:hypothetical protein
MPMVAPGAMGAGERMLDMATGVYEWAGQAAAAARRSSSWSRGGAGARAASIPSADIRATAPAGARSAEARPRASVVVYAPKS